jgi:hypothetical protein
MSACNVIDAQETGVGSRIRRPQNIISGLTCRTARRRNVSKHGLEGIEVRPFTSLASSIRNIFLCALNSSSTPMEHSLEERYTYCSKCKTV